MIDRGMRRFISGAGGAALAVALQVSTVWAGCEAISHTWAFPKDELSRKGLANCFVSNANITGENADMTPEVFLAKGTKVEALTNDTRRCRSGRKAGESCTKASDCPDGGECVAPEVGACAADAKGKRVYFIFSGNPTGENADLSPEVFSVDGKRGIAQQTSQTWFCARDRAKSCASHRDCPPADGRQDYCTAPEMDDLQVGASGKAVLFRTTGDLGDNAGHASALYMLSVGKKKSAAALIAGGGSPFACSEDTANAFQACTRDADCGTTCGDGDVEGAEQCETTSDCADGQVCDQCSCRTVVCGDGLVDLGEACEPTVGCSGTCAPDCSTCTPSN